MTSYQRSMALYCIVSDIHQAIGGKSNCLTEKKTGPAMHRRTVGIHSCDELQEIYLILTATTLIITEFK